MAFGSNLFLPPSAQLDETGMPSLVNRSLDGGALPELMKNEKFRLKHIMFR